MVLALPDNCACTKKSACTEKKTCSKGQLQGARATVPANARTAYMGMHGHLVTLFHSYKQNTCPFASNMHLYTNARVGSTDKLPSMKVKTRPDMRPSTQLGSKNMRLPACHAPKHEGENST
eukprot:1159428-Pelagomonas_calceolata.AAC.5